MFYKTAVLVTYRLTENFELEHFERKESFESTKFAHMLLAPFISSYLYILYLTYK